MSETPRRNENQKSAGQTSEKSDPSITDLPEQVSSDEAEKVRGGLNPQPLPPRIAPPI